MQLTRSRPCSTNALYIKYIKVMSSCYTDNNS